MTSNAQPLPKSCGYATHVDRGSSTVCPCRAPTCAAGSRFQSPGLHPHLAPHVLPFEPGDRRSPACEVPLLLHDNPELHERTIEPHSLVRAGRRWHVRGFCLLRQDFRDFVLGRMTKAQLLPEPCTADASADASWSTVLKVRLVAHPRLSPAQQLVVRNEYFNGASARVESCRLPS